MRNGIVITIVFILTFICIAGVLADAQQPLHEIPGTPMANNFVLQDSEGNIHNLHDYRGRVVIINFWATWCPPCRDELPSMQRSYEILKQDNVEILAINVGEDVDTIFTFMADYPVTFPLLLDIDSKVIKDYPVMGLPTTYIVDPKGRLRYRAIGTREWDDKTLVDTIRKLQSH